MQVLHSGEEYTLLKERIPIGQAVLREGYLASFMIDPAWRRRGYGSYLLKEILRSNDGFSPAVATTFCAPLPQKDNPAAWALAKKFGFLARNGILCRQRVPDLTAVELTHRFLAQRVAPGGLYLDATCGNGHDTLFLCQLAGADGQVIGMDIQDTAVQSTNRLLADSGMAGIGRAVQCDHRELLRYAPQGSADCVMFNFGWLPGADHTVHSTAEGSLAALKAGLTALRPGGVLSAVLYSGKIIGSSEKEAALAFFRSLPLTDYTVLICEFGNWDATAPLPCFVIRKIQ